MRRERTRPWVWPMPSSIIPVCSAQWRGAIAYSRQTPRKSRWRSELSAALVYSLCFLYANMVFWTWLNLNHLRIFFLLFNGSNWFSELIWGNSFVCIFTSFLSSPLRLHAVLVFAFSAVFRWPTWDSEPEEVKTMLETVPPLPAQDSCKFELKIPERVTSCFNTWTTKLPCFHFQNEFLQKDS